MIFISIKTFDPSNVDLVFVCVQVLLALVVTEAIIFVAGAMEELPEESKVLIFVVGKTFDPADVAIVFLCMQVTWLRVNERNTSM